MSLIASPVATPPLAAASDVDAVPAFVPVTALARLPLDRAAAIGGALRLLGGQLVIAQASDPDTWSAPAGAPYLLDAGLVAQLGDERMTQLRAQLSGHPVLIFPGAEEDAGAVGPALAALFDCTISPGPAAQPRTYTVAGDEPALAPFGGAQLTEQRPRRLAATLGRGVRPLICAEGGAVVAAAPDRGDGPRWATVVGPLGSLRAGEKLRRYFHPGDFLELLPLLAFTRAALATAGWQAPRAHATFMIDDPNLRSSRYGWVDYERLRTAGRDHRFHTSIAMAPIDAAKTRAEVAALFRQSPELSLVMHGVYHTHHEFAQSVAPAQAHRDLGFGVAAMDGHRRRHGVACPPVMTFPFSRCSSEWLRAMRDIGLTAAVTGPTCFPFLADLDLITNPAYDMLPAELGHHGFPILTRTFLTQPREDLLFGAWLGKPLIVYLHHEQLRGGEAPLIETAAFVNERIAPEWGSMAQIVAANYQQRVDQSGPSLRLFSNRVTLAAGAPRPATVIKPDVWHLPDERIWIDERELSVRQVRGLGTVAEVPAADPSTAAADPQARLTVAAGPRLRPARGQVRLAHLAPARGRRSLTEIRDRLLPAGSRVGLDGAGEPAPSMPAFTG